MADLNHNILDGLSEKQKEAVTLKLKELGVEESLIKVLKHVMVSFRPTG